MTPYTRPDVAAFLAYLNAVPGPKMHEVGAPAARMLMLGMRAEALGRVRTWLTIATPPDDGQFPYRLVVVDSVSGKVLTSDSISAGTVIQLRLDSDTARMAAAAAATASSTPSAPLPSFWRYGSSPTRLPNATRASTGQASSSPAARSSA